jgi:hypothetical protein
MQSSQILLDYVEAFPSVLTTEESNDLYPGFL